MKPKGEKKEIEELEETISLERFGVRNPIG